MQESKTYPTQTLASKYVTAHPFTGTDSRKGLNQRARSRYVTAHPFTDNQKGLNQRARESMRPFTLFGSKTTSPPVPHPQELPPPPPSPPLACDFSGDVNRGLLGDRTLDLLGDAIVSDTV